MAPDDSNNFLLLAASLKTITSRSIHMERLERARLLMRDYLAGFLRARLLLFFLLFGILMHIYRTTNRM